MGSRQPYFDALELLERGDLDAALKAFKRASRKAEPPFDAMSLIGAAECQHALNKTTAALTTLRRVADDDSCADGARIAAWRKIATIEEARDNRDAVDAARRALDELGDSFDTGT
jgi:tetratricopeptide (TPR) repeat protein